VLVGGLLCLLSLFALAIVVLLAARQQAHESKR
jgi:hypothetical protein